SPPGLTRGSIFFARSFAKRMDCRVEPGNDGVCSPIVHARLYTLEMPFSSSITIPQWVRTRDDWHSPGKPAIGRPAAVPVRPRARRRERDFAVLRLSLRLLLQGLPGIRAFPRAHGRARRSRRHRHLPDAAGARDAYRGRGGPAMSALLQQGAALVRRLLPDPDRQHRRRCALPGGRGNSLFHGPPGGRPFPRRGAWSSPLPNLRTLGRQATPTDGAAALVRDLRASRNEAAGLVGARARPADSVLRQSHKRALLRAARAHAS